jgi:hypothetical protein
MNSTRTFLTSAHPFFTAACSSELFSVNPGVPAGKALQAASSYQDAALDRAETTGAEIYLVELAKAIVDAVAVELIEAERSAA